MDVIWATACSTLWSTGQVLGQLLMPERTSEPTLLTCVLFFAADGDLVEVPENVAPLLPIYTVILQRPVSGLRVS